MRAKKGDWIIIKKADGQKIASKITKVNKNAYIVTNSNSTRVVQKTEDFVLISNLIIPLVFRLIEGIAGLIFSIKERRELLKLVKEEKKKLN